MSASRTAILVAGGVLYLSLVPAKSQTSRLNHLPPARAPCSVLSAHPCHPSFCGVFHRGPCFPYFEPPYGQTLRLTITSTDENDPANKKAADTDNAAGNMSAQADAANTQKSEGEQTLDNIGDMFAALRGCWVPPPKDEARHGMEYTIRFAFKRTGETIAAPRMTFSSHEAPPDVRALYREAIDDALKRCTPLRFSEGMGDAIAGRPIAIRFVDERTIGSGSGK